MDFKEKFNTVMKYFQVITLIKKFKESNLKKSFNAKENKYIKNMLYFYCILKILDLLTLLINQTLL